MSLWNSFSYSFKEFHYLFFSVVVIFIFNILLEYNNFLNFKNQKHYLIDNALLTHQYIKYNKKNKKYWVLKLQTENFTFYTTSFKDLNLSKNQFLSLRIITHNINFKDYLSKSFYAPSYDFEKLKEKEYNPIISYFLNQHTNEKIKEFYGALFFALPISLELRNDVNYYGIAHLIAISGYHIGLLFSLIFFILAPIYSFFQKRYFPYRNLRLDLSILIFALLLAYACLIGFVPSFVRSLIMAFWVFYLLCKNIKIINFVTLFCSILLCISLYPRLLFSIGFLFSILGIILSGIFVIFYPLVLFLHLINYGDLLNFILDEFFKFKIYGTNIHIPFWIFISYLIASLISVRFKYLAFLCIFANFIPFIMIVI
ncbi:ComEC/Rec2 family competence protein [Campylobacter jejuni]|nr:ComEC/Rec2 family competence protein [Campylobacter jejuni]HEC3028159.1 ComEC/Rec2 family competence protein [Campylobacter jejuni]